MQSLTRFKLLKIVMNPSRYMLRSRNQAPKTMAKLFRETSNVATQLPIKRRKRRREDTAPLTMDHEMIDLVAPAVSDPVTVDLTDPVTFDPIQNGQPEELPTEPSDSTEGLYREFNTFTDVGRSGIVMKDFVSATGVKNHLMKDPLLDWLKLYYKSHGFNTENERKLKVSKPEDWFLHHRKRVNDTRTERSSLQVLFQKGNDFEEAIYQDLQAQYTDAVQLIPPCRGMEAHERGYLQLQQMMHQGVPIILQAPLINHLNKTWGTADLVVRSDWLPKIYANPNYDLNEMQLPSPGLSGCPNYHYVVIDIKYTTLSLTANGKNILNNRLFPAYKGQLLIYTAAVGQIQGFTPTKGFVMAKSWNFSRSRQNKKTSQEGYNCYDLLGVIDYANRDHSFLERTSKALEWVRRCRYFGLEWSLYPQPSHPELYPNMCNSQYDSPFHGVKKDIAERIKELTSVWMVGVKHRQHAHEQDIYQYTDSRCTSKTLGITGDRVGPTVDQILGMLQDTSGQTKLLPHTILNNDWDWQTKQPCEFYVDFESLQPIFNENQPIDIANSKMENNIIFMVGVGYPDEHGQWQYRCFHFEHCRLNDVPSVMDQEKQLFHQVQQFLSQEVNRQLHHYGVTNPELFTPRVFHWGHAEVSMLRTVNRRHGGSFEGLFQQMDWIDMLSVFRKEPITVHGAKKFGLKEIARQMYRHNMVHTKWEDDGPSGGLGAMTDSIHYYNVMENHKMMTPEEQVNHNLTLESAVERFGEVITYNEVDCKVVWEIVDYLREHHSIDSDDEL